MPIIPGEVKKVQCAKELEPTISTHGGDTYSHHGGCLAFLALAAVEGINKIVTGSLVSLSEQELIDYDKFQDQSCNRGLMDNAFRFMIKNGGTNSEANYPFTSHDGRCDPTQKNAKVVSIDSHEDVPINNERALQKAVAHQPVSVAIEASSRAFQLYHSISYC